MMGSVIAPMEHGIPYRSVIAPSIKMEGHGDFYYLSKHYDNFYYLSKC